MCILSSMECFGFCLGYGRPPGYFDEEGNLVPVPEMIPELVVPDLTGFKVLQHLYLEDIKLLRILVLTRCNPYMSFEFPAETLRLLSSTRY